ncbi:MAG: cation transporter [Oscillospiraceae bacterium]|nr:cation transporter [Oscillospiraceae bacterium]
MAVPAVMSQLIVLIYNLADTYFIGQTNNPYMVAGVSLILPLFNVSLAIGSMFGVGGGALIPKLLAVDDREEGSRVAAYCIRLGLLVAFAFSVLVLLFMRPLLSLLGAGPNTYAYSRTYVLMVLVAGGIPTITANVLSNLLRSLSLSREAGIGVALGGVLNIFLDPLFMFVLLPPGNEVLGVGIATFLSNVVSCLYCLAVFCRRQREIPVNFLAPSPEVQNRSLIFTVGIPGTVGALLFDLDYMVLDKLAAGYGDIALAAIGIVLKAERFPQQVGIGLCQSMVPLVAYSWALKDYKRVKEIMACILKTGAVIAVVSIVLYELFPGQIIRFFIAEPETLLIGTNFLRIRSMAAVIMFFCFFVVFLFQGFGIGKVSFWLAMLRWAVLNIPMLFILRHFLGMYGLVWSQFISDLTTVVISYLYLWRYMKTWEAQ